MDISRFFYIVSLGCAKNLVDSEVICGQLAVNGYFLTDQLEDASLIIINTCGFLGSARTEADEEIEAALQWRKEEEGRLVVVSGCYPQKNPEAFFEKHPDVDLVMGIDDLSNVSTLIDDLLEKRDVIHGIGLENKAPTYIYDHNTPRLQLTMPHLAYVKIADGCNHGCRYCSIPLIRGRQRSRTVESIIQECKNLLANGAKELNLIAQDTSRYGEDLNDGTNLIKLLKEIDVLPGNFWIRVLYFHPCNVSDELLETLPKIKHLVPYVDIPLQHISNNMLNAMGRKMTSEDTKKLMNKIRGSLPNVAVRTTFIVGFPGETEEDFNELLEYVKTFKFDRLGVFTYSPESGTAAAKITEGVVAEEVAEKRKELIMNAQQKIAIEKNRSYKGKVLPVLIDQILEERQNGKVYTIAEGRTMMDAPDVDNKITFLASKKQETGDQVLVRVTETDAYDLYGEIIKKK